MKKKAFALFFLLSLSAGAAAEESKFFKIFPSKSGNSDKQAVVRLKNGNAISGTLVFENDKKVVINWEGGDITLARAEISSIERGGRIKEDGGLLIQEAGGAAWPHANSPVLQLTNGQVIDGEIGAVTPEIVSMKKDLGDGDVAYLDFPRPKIESLEFRPVRTDEDAKIEDDLRARFPKMRIHRQGLVVLFTDSEGSALTELKSVLREQMTALYLEFFELVKGRQPAHPHFVVVFDDPYEYFQHALADGVPAWLCPGYFTPAGRTLYLVNYSGNQFTSLVYEVVQGVRKGVGQQGDAVKSAVDSYYHGIVDGAVRDASVKVENAVGFMSAVFTEQTVSTLRHEVTHEFFHDWGLQTILVSEMKENKEISKKKKDMLEAKTIEKKKELLGEILGLRKRESAAKLDTRAANSWYVEGIAEYAATSAVGRPNVERQYLVKQALKKNELWPIEQLTVYKMGSFPGIAVDAAFSAYAQSWSLVDFLMKKHRKGFIAYLERMAKETPQGNQDFTWLIEAVGTDLRELEKEWHAHIAAYDEVEDPEIEQFIRIREILGS